MSRQILVMGGYGAVGEPLMRELAGRGYTPIVGGRDAQRAERVVDARDEGSLRAALRGVDLVINASGLEQPMAVEVVTASGVPFSTSPRRRLTYRRSSRGNPRQR